MGEKQVLKLISPIPPSQNHYTEIRVVKNGRKHIPIVYKNNEAKEYEKVFDKIVRDEVKKQEYKTNLDTKQHFYVDAVFYFDRKHKDSSNADKVLLDVITKTQLVWKDDSSALFRPQRIYFDSSNPRIELSIYLADYIGIFDNQEQLDSFEAKCKTCCRYKRNCPILKKAKEGRIQDEICNLECCKYKETKKF